MEPHWTMAYDVETLRGPDEVDGGWDNPAAMGLRSAVVYDRNRDLYLFFDEGLKEAVRLCLVLEGEAVLSFNGVRFDNRVIGKSADSSWLDVDLLQEVSRLKFGCSIDEAERAYGAEAVHGDGSIGLGGLARGTLGMGKIGHGSESPQYTPDRLYQYNLHDVRLTVKLAEFYGRYGFLVDGSGRVLRKSEARKES